MLTGHRNAVKRAGHEGERQDSAKATGNVVRGLVLDKPPHYACSLPARNSDAHPGMTRWRLLLCARRANWPFRHHAL